MAKNVRERARKYAENKDTRPRAYAKHIRISPFKVRSVLKVIKGKGYAEAVAILENMPTSSSLPVKKLVVSAGANAEHNLNLNKDDLYVAECFADPGPTLKRMMPRARGSADRILKRTSHITVILDVKAVK